MPLISFEEHKFEIGSEHVVCIEFMSMRFVPGLICPTVPFLSTPVCEEKKRVMKLDLSEAECSPQDVVYYVVLSTSYVAHRIQYIGCYVPHPCLNPHPSWCHKGMPLMLSYSQGSPGAVKSNLIKQGVAFQTQALRLSQKLTQQFHTPSPAPKATFCPL